MDEETIDLGPLTYRFQDGALSGPSAPVRDGSWGRLPEEGAAWRRDVRRDAASLDRRFAVGDGALSCHLHIETSSTGLLTAEMTMTALRDDQTNRAGLCLRNPLNGLTGTPFTVRGVSGPDRTGRFPGAIAPAQPATDLAALPYVVHGVHVRISMQGEIFEMEGQRNWSDASFETYRRPVSHPLPHRIAAAETLRQRIEVRLSGEGITSQPGAAADTTVRMPAILVALDPSWLPVGAMPGNSGLLRWGPGGEWSARALGRVRDLMEDRALDLGLVLADVVEEAAVVALALDEAGLVPRRIAALPAPYLKSHKPDAPWPGEPMPEDAAVAACAAFPHARIGAGMLTYVTELNRRPVAGGDDVTHGSTAIAHAADDLPVIDTFEVLPAVFAPARALAGDRAYRLGLVAIGMRSNPDGAALAPNPTGDRITMTDADPRPGTPFAAAYAVAACALAARRERRRGPRGRRRPAGRRGPADRCGDRGPRRACRAGGRDRGHAPRSARHRRRLDDDHPDRP